MYIPDDQISRTQRVDKFLDSSMGFDHSEDGLITKISQYRKMFLQYDDPDFTAIVPYLIPLEEMEQKVKDQEHSREKMLPLLLEWFKDDFFSWINARCNVQSCEMFGKSIPASNAHQAMVTPEEKKHGASRVEIYCCPVCRHIERFPRYNDPVKLLETRTGRCGEWANCFTGILVALGYRARLVLDLTDHVWTEVYLPSANRWAHMDPCEKKFDCPLLYEKGWGKSLSYVFAFGSHEVEDVILRYTLEPEKVFQRRNMISEEKLLNILNEVNKIIDPLDEAKDRRAAEQKELQWTPESLEQKRKAVDDGNLSGRISGSIDWRIARGELGKVTNGHIFCIKTQKGMLFNLVDDLYTVDEGESLSGWDKGVFSAQNIAKKIEHDWKKVYLARNPNMGSNEPGEITWKFDVSQIDWKECKITFSGYECDNGILKVTLNGNQVPFSSELNEITFFKEFLDQNKDNQLELIAHLSGGQGPCLWQKSQLFRSCLVTETKKPSFSISFG